MPDMMNPVQRTVAKDYSNVNTKDQMGGVAPAAAPLYITRDGSAIGSKGPAENQFGVYVDPAGGTN